MDFIVFTCLYMVLEWTNYLLVYLTVFRATVIKNKMIIGASFAISLLIAHVIAFGIHAIKNIFIVQAALEEEVLLGCAAGTAIILLIFYIYLKKSNENLEEVVISRRQYLLFFGGAVCIFIILGCAQLLSSSEELSVRERNMLGIAVAVIVIVCFLMNIWNGMLIRSRDEYKAQLKQYEELVYRQQCQVQAILESNDDLRRYRHDMNIHLTAMRAICEQDNSGELGQYAREMLQQIEHIQVRTYTGNSAVDGILGNLIHVAEKNGISVCCEASLPTELFISAFDLCTILSNLIRNAIDACMELSVIERKKGILVIVYPMNENIYLKVENPTKHVVSVQDNILHSTKKDQKNHGFGSRNIKRAVEKYQGRLNYDCREGLFIAEVFL